MNDWTVFTNLWTSFNAPFLAAVNAQAAQLAASLGVPATLVTTIYIGVVFGLDLYTGGAGHPIMDLARRCMRLALILTALGAAFYTDTVANFLLVTLPGELTQAVAGGAAVGAGAFDHLAGQVWVSVVQVWNNVSLLNAKTYFTALFAIIYLADGGFAIGLGFALWAITQVGLGLLVAVGPLAIVCLIMPQTARFFAGWLSTVVTFIVAQIMLVTVVSVLITTINTILGQMLTVNAATGSDANDIGGQIHQMTNAGVMFFVAAIVSLSVVPIARAIGGGAATELNGVTRWATGVFGSAARAAGSVAAHPVATADALGKAGAAGMRSIKAVGRAL